MNTSIKFITSLLFIVVSGISFSSPNIELESTELYPLETYALELFDLMPGIPYKVSCDLTSENNHNNKVLMRVGTDNMRSNHDTFTVKLNGKELSSSGWNTVFQLPEIENKIVFETVYGLSDFDKNVLFGDDYYDNPSSLLSSTGYSAIEFSNADSDDVVQLNNCMATPILK